MELLDIIDEQGNPTGRTVERETAHREGIPHRTAHLWLVRRREGRVQVLLQKRAAHKSSYPGCYDISSAGHIPAGVDYGPSAIRELQEELGISAKEEDLILCGQRRIHEDAEFFGKPFHDRQISRVFCLWLDLEEDAFTLQAEEVEAVRWMDLEECIRAVEENAFPHCIVPEELRLVEKEIEN